MNDEDNNMNDRDDDMNMSDPPDSDSVDYTKTEMYKALKDMVGHKMEELQSLILARNTATTKVKKKYLLKKIHAKRDKILKYITELAKFEEPSRVDDDS